MNNIKLICFDLDETIITHNSWKELGFALGVSYEEDKKLFEEYEAGIVTYEKWTENVLERYMKHTDANRENITKILSNYTYTDGAREIISYLKNQGYKLVLISGAADILVNIVAKDLGIQFAKASSTLVFDEQGHLQSIHTYGDEIGAKQAHLQSFCDMLGIRIEECACIADGANDIEMFRRTGHGITFKGLKIESEAWKVIKSLSDLKEIF